jgi:prolyl oligopeptidase
LVGLKTVTYGYLNQIPFRDALKNRMEKLELRKNRAHLQRNFTYYSKITDYKINVYERCRWKEEVFLDPNTF